MLPKADSRHPPRSADDNVRDLFSRFKLYTGSVDAERSKFVHTIVREVTVHCQAEELVLYKALKEHGMAKEMEHDKGQSTSSHPIGRIIFLPLRADMYPLPPSADDHVKMDKMFAYIDSLRPNAPNYAQHVTESVDLFLKHSDEEEAYLPALISKLSEQENTRITKEFLKARTTVPTHPHPSSPHSGGFAQKMFNTFEKMGDQIADAVGPKREYVEVAQTHAMLV